LPLGIKQKGILATCNYVARRHGVKKLMPIAQAKKICPDLVLADGEDLSPFRDVSKRLHALLRSYSWNGKVERLGLDEVFLDVTDLVSYNVELLNKNSLRQSYFCLSRSDPEVGFEYDATCFAGCVLGGDGVPSYENVLYMRLLVASHLARYLRLQIEEQGYTSACGISTNKLLAKLAGDKNKPQNQTVLLALCQEDVLSFMDEHSLRKVPGIGSKTTRVLEGFVLGKEPEPDTHSMECSTTVGQVRTHADIAPAILSRLLSGPGSERGLGPKVWALLHGVDDTDVKPARDIPTQISIEDSYRRLNHPSEIHRELLAITTSLLRRMHTDLLAEEEEEEDDDPPNPTTATTTTTGRRWLARPKTIRLSTRPYTTFQDDKPYNWARHSRSCPLPSFVFHTGGATAAGPPPLERIAARLVAEILLPLFHKLNPSPTKPSTTAPSPPVPGGGGGGSGSPPPFPHHQTPDGDAADPHPDPTSLKGAEHGPSPGGGWNIGLMNVCVTNMSAGDGGDIGAMFRRQEGVLREFTVYDPAGGGEVDEGGVGGDDNTVDDGDGVGNGGEGKGEEGGWVDTDVEMEMDSETDDVWDNDEAADDRDAALCPLCERLVPRFAVLAHERYHSLGDA
jgi:DNA polymerase iota